MAHLWECLHQALDNVLRHSKALAQLLGEDVGQADPGIHRKLMPGFGLHLQEHLEPSI